MGFRLCVVYLKLFHKRYAPLTAGQRAPFRADAVLPEDRRGQLDKLYATVEQALQALCDPIGLQAAA